MRLRTRLLVPFLLLLVLVGTATAANDPGHDTLYVLKVGDNVTGSLNLTGNLTANFLRATALIYGNYLDIWANGTLQTVTSRPAIQAPSVNSLYLDSTQNIYIATQGGTTGTVQFGPTGSSNLLVVNVSGQLLQQNVKVCLQNGTFCPGSLSSANITGSGTTNYVTKWTSTANLATSLLYDTGSAVGIGTTIPAATLTLNSSAAAGSFLVLNTTGSNHVFVNGSTGFVGIATTAAFNTLTVNGSMNASGNVYDSGNRVCTSNNGLCGSGGANVSGSGTANYVARWSNTTSLSTGLLYDNGTNVGIGTTSPNAFLDVHGTAIINSSAASGSFQVLNVTGSTHVFVNGTSGNVGIGTATPTQKLDVNGSMNLSGTAYLAATNLTTLQIMENGNLYYTDARAASALQNTTILRNGTNANFNTLNASTLNAGTTNLTTAQIAEGTNLYYTDARAAASVQNTTLLRNNTNAVFNNLTTGNLTVTGTAAIASTNLTSLQITENGNLYYTDARVASAIQNTTILRNGTNANFNTLNASTLNVGTTNLTCSQVNGCVVGAIASVPYQSSAGGWTNTTTTSSTALNVNVTTGNLTVVNGNVGIGTTSPTGNLEVRQSSGTVINISASSPNGNVMLVLASKGTAGADQQWKVGSGINGNKYDFSVNDDTSGNKALTIAGSTDYVGIGTTIPAAAFTVNSSAAAGSLLIQNTTGSTHLFVNGNTGNVGIGTASPGETLEVLGSALINSSASGGSLQVENDNIGTTSTDGLALVNNISGSTQYSPRLRLTGNSFKNAGAVSNVEDWILQVEPRTVLGQASSLTISSQQIGAGYINRLTITNINGGQVGVGTAGPTQKLDVNGSGNVSGNISITGANNRLFVGNGTNGCMGRAVLVAGRVLVNTTCVTTNSNILLSEQVTGGTPGALYTNNRTSGTSFGVNSTSATDTSTIAWLIVEPTS